MTSKSDNDTYFGNLNKVFEEGHAGGEPPEMFEVRGLLVENESRRLCANKILKNKEHALEVAMWILDKLN